MNTDIESFNFKNKRLAGIDFGLKRVGVAVCDEFHITISPKTTLHYQEDNFWELLLELLVSERIGGVILGVPYRDDNRNEKLIAEIEKFEKILNEKTGLQVIKIDEAYSSKRAVETMIETGKKKKDRAKKENIDKIAAALILRDFLTNMEA